MEIFNKLRVHFFFVFLNKRAILAEKLSKNHPIWKELKQYNSITLNSMESSLNKCKFVVIGKKILKYAEDPLEKVFVVEFEGKVFKCKVKIKQKGKKGLQSI